MFYVKSEMLLGVVFMLGWVCFILRCWLYGYLSSIDVPPEGELVLKCAFRPEALASCGVSTLVNEPLLRRRKTVSIGNISSSSGK